MFLQPRSLKKSVLAGLAVCAVAPAAAGAVPTIQGQSIAAGGGPGVSASDFAPQSLAAPDQVDRVTTPKSLNGPPTWPANPRAGIVHRPTAGQPSDDGGLDTGVWVAIGGGALVLVTGLGLVGAARMRPNREQLA